jgi:pimeloyl-ACP methyl ester carboxylesterase
VAAARQNGRSEEDPEVLWLDSPVVDDRDEILGTPGGRRIGWMARGPADGTPVLYLHGWPGSRLEQLLIPADVLHRFGVRLISIDRPGYGKTDPLPGERSARARDVLSLCDALGIDRFPAIGVSGGGSNVLTLAAIAPDRITRILSVSGQMPQDDEAAIAALPPEELASLPLYRRGRIPELEALCAKERDDWLAPGMLDGFPTSDESERRWLAQTWVRDAVATQVAEAFRPGLEGYIEDSLTCVKPFDVDVTTIRCPVTAVHGTADTVCPLPNLRRVLATIDTSELILLDGLNHIGPFLYPDLLISLVVGRD